MIENIDFGTYVFFCAFCGIALVWVYLLVPETNGRTLEQMDSVFKDKTTTEESERRAAIESALWQSRQEGRHGQIKVEA